jgi:hypothetical protein
VNRISVFLILITIASCTKVSPPGDGALPDGPLSALGGANDIGVTALAEHGTGVYAVGPNLVDPDDPFPQSNIFIRKYSTSGSLVWRRQFRLSEFDILEDVAADTSNNAYVAGSTYVDPSDYTEYAFIRKYTAAGQLAWTRRFSASSDDSDPFIATFPRGLATYGRNTFYVVGQSYGKLSGAVGTGDLFIRKYSADGQVRWTRQFGFTNNPAGIDYMADVAADRNGNAYVVGSIDNAGVGEDYSDGFVRKYTPTGRVAWTRQLDFGINDGVGAVAVSNGNVYLAVGYQAGSTDFGDPEYGARIAKVFTDGRLAKGWGFTYNTPNSDSVGGLSADENLYFSAFTEVPRQDGYGVVVKLKPNGDQAWRKRMAGGALVARAPNEVYVAAPPFLTQRDPPLLRRLDGTNGEAVWSR